MEARSRSGHKFWLGLLIGVVLTLLVLVGLAVYAVGCTLGKVAEALQTDTKVAIRATTSNGQLELDLSYGKEATGITTITVAEMDGNRLWEVSGQGTAKPAKVNYGQLPADGSLKQVFPEDGSPPPDIRGKRVQVRVVNRFQVAFGPGQEVTDLTVEVPK
ncbi:MAG TPA: hypothetical protein VKD90_12400 [Gemmataceae bacterium]|nr:hypothetical protein [Gemmataceae bacterium]